MSFPFGSGNNPYAASQGAKKDDVFARPQPKQFEFEFKKNIEDVSLFDITSEAELNDTGSKLTTDELFGWIKPQMDGPKWLGLTGKGAMGDEPKIMETSFLKNPPKRFDKEGNAVKPIENGNDWNWNTFA